MVCSFSTCPVLEVVRVSGYVAAMKLHCELVPNSPHSLCSREAFGARTICLEMFEIRRSDGLPPRFESFARKKVKTPAPTVCQGPVALSAMQASTALPSLALSEQTS